MRKHRGIKPLACCFLVTCVLFEPVLAEKSAQVEAMASTMLCVDGVAQPIRAAVAASEAERNRGLMGRPALAADAGMPFRFSQPPPAGVGFYMYRTLIPLDVAFLDGQGTIVSIKTMVPCVSKTPSRCPVYRAGEAFVSALEVNAGFFRRNGVKKGDKIQVAGEAGCEG